MILTICVVPQKQRSYMHVEYMMRPLGRSHGSVDEFEAFHMRDECLAYQMLGMRL